MDGLCGKGSRAVGMRSGNRVAGAVTTALAGALMLVGCSGGADGPDAGKPGAPAPASTPAAAPPAPSPSEPATALPPPRKGRRPRSRGLRPPAEPAPGRSPCGPVGDSAEPEPGPQPAAGELEADALRPEGPVDPELHGAAARAVAAAVPQLPGRGVRAYAPDSRWPAPRATASRPRARSIWWAVQTAADTTGLPRSCSASSMAPREGICTQAESTTAPRRRSPGPARGPAAGPGRGRRRRGCRGSRGPGWSRTSMPSWVR
ncbi:hypothetical protein SAVIM40S_01373 [Streptomyces avidinii]